MAQTRRTIEELIAEEEQKTEQSKARMAELRARQKIELRKRDTHRKIVAGAILMAHVKIDPRFRKVVQEAFSKAVTDPKHRAAIADLLDETAFGQAMQVAADKAAIEAKEAAVATAEKTPAAPERAAQNHEGPRATQMPASAAGPASASRAPAPSRPPVSMAGRQFKPPGDPPAGSAPA